jgi:acyl-CoA synthetase (AMP-forming)/AMP-acid ligase II
VPMSEPRPSKQKAVPVPADPVVRDDDDVNVRQIVEAVSHGQPNACDLIHEIARKDPELVATFDRRTGGRRSFGSLSTTIAKVACRLKNLGVRPRDRVAVFVGDGPRFVVVVNALFHLGAVPVLIDPGMGLDNLAGCVREQRPRVLLGIARAQLLRWLRRDAFRSVELSLVVDGWFPGASTVQLDGDDPSDTYLPMHRQASHEPAAVLYTSGSTGAPKGVLYTHGMLMAQAATIRDIFGIARGDVDVCCFLPFALFSVAMGTTAVFPHMDFRTPARARPERIYAALNEGLDGRPATSAFASPALWEPFSRWVQATGKQLPGVRRILTAGAPVRPQLHERLLQALPEGDVFTPYGATEALPVAFMNGRAVLEETAALTRRGQGTCVGRVAPGVTVKIVALHDDPIPTLFDARELAPGEIGEIIVRGACVTRAYDETSERARDANALSKIVDGDAVWHRMGDAGSVDDQGRVWFCGRKNHRVDKEGGLVLHSIPVEAVVETLVDGTGQRAALVGVGERGRQRAVVFVETGDKPIPLLEAVRALPGCGAVDEVRPFAGSFPVDKRHNAKIEREKLAALAAKA